MTIERAPVTETVDRAVEVLARADFERERLSVTPWEDLRTVQPDLWKAYMDSAAVGVAALRADGRLVPEGWVAVPEEPTRAMIEAAYGRPLTGREYEPDIDDIKDDYRAMLAAAPSPEPVKET